MSTRFRGEVSARQAFGGEKGVRGCHSTGHAEKRYPEWGLRGGVEEILCRKGVTESRTRSTGVRVNERDSRI